MKALSCAGAFCLSTISYRMFGRSKLATKLGAPASPLAYEELVEQTLDALAAHLEAHLDVEKLLSLAR